MTCLSLLAPGRCSEHQGQQEGGDGGKRADHRPLDRDPGKPRPSPGCTAPSLPSRWDQMAPPTPSLLRGHPPPTTLPQPREWATVTCTSGWMPTGLPPERGPPSCYRAGPEATAGSFPQKPLEALDPAPGQEARGWRPPSLSVEALFRGENEKMATPGDKASTALHTSSEAGRRHCLSGPCRALENKAWAVRGTARNFLRHHPSRQTLTVIAWP